ncbi:MAG: hypothetical protein IJ080_03815 [Oscillospiraceae bacterium]|nr:hypothetical protein [Oscillospiraceae bacterium]MBQ8978875.1 hypothetical protein [Oscillospiraceae bacterium]
MEMTTHSYKCPNCSGELKWSPDDQKYSCEWCGSLFTNEELGENKPQEQTQEDVSFSEETDLYVCSSCGASIFCDHNTAATFCYYCHNPVQLQGRLTGAYKPEKIIPFKLSRETAEQKFKELCGKKWFLPFGFLSESTLEKLTGLYVPFWLADTRVDAQVDATSVEKIEHRHGSRVDVTERHYAHSRKAHMYYEGIPADGSKKIDDNIMDAVEPFDYKDLKGFDMSYLSGFLCDRYDVDKTEVLPRIKAKVEKGAVEALTADIHGPGAVVVTSKDVRILSTNWHYMLLPVWFFTYHYHGKQYDFALNGQTGKAVGQYPVSAPKIALLIAGLTLVIGLIGWFIMTMM